MLYSNTNFIFAAAKHMDFNTVEKVLLRISSLLNVSSHHFLRQKLLSRISSL